MLAIPVHDALNYKLDAAFVTAPLYLPELLQLTVRDQGLEIIPEDNVYKLSAAFKQESLKIVVFSQGCFFRARLESWLGSKGILRSKCTVLHSIEGIVIFC